MQSAPAPHLVLVVASVVPLVVVVTVAIESPESCPASRTRIRIVSYCIRIRIFIRIRIRIVVAVLAVPTVVTIHPTTITTTTTTNTTLSHIEIVSETSSTYLPHVLTHVCSHTMPTQLKLQLIQSNMILETQQLQLNQAKVEINRLKDTLHPKLSTNLCPIVKLLIFNYHINR